VITDIEKQQNAGDSLEEIKPVAEVAIAADVGARLLGDEEAVGGVIDRSATTLLKRASPPGPTAWKFEYRCSIRKPPMGRKPVSSNSFRAR